MIINEIKNYINYLNIKDKKKSIIFFSEGFSSWNFIKYQFNLFLKSNFNTYYITSSIDEYKFLRKKFASQKKNIFYCGSGTIRTIWLNSITANIFITTIPDLNVYQWKKSPFVKTYCYFFHSLGSTNMIYNNKAFDNYDNIYCCTDYQFNELNENKLNNKLNYNIFKSGYNHFDFLIEGNKNLENRNSKFNVLIAPTWSLDTETTILYLNKLIEVLLNDKRFHLILRFHPMNQVEYLKKIKNLQNLNITIDELNNYNSFFNSDILITDWSTSSIEYSLALLKPSIHINSEPKIRNKTFDKNNLHTTYEYKFRKSIGEEIEIKDIENLNYEMIYNLINDNLLIENIKKLRQKHIYNISNSIKILNEEIINEFGK